ncbi:hypothetical protein FHR20_004495 [Sphingomonas leidyi]|uniref:DNA-binding response regulator n=1 Tax=Sphingomonas leidyi TaxID=68569 RepID=A0A7X5V427_9SPHN|nr:hypothetical protein [Sphingomonas leidyi]
MGHKLLLVEDDEPTAAYIVKGMSPISSRE